MARPIYYPTRDSYTTDSDGRPCANVPVRIFTQQTGGTRVTDLQYVSAGGALTGAVSGGVLSSDTNGLLPAFAGPDGGPTTLFGDHGMSQERVALTSDPTGTGGGGGVPSVVGLTGLITGAQILADSSISSALAGKAATTHASTHASAGTDPITLTQAQITGLIAALAAKADLVGGLLPTAQLPPIAITAVRVVASQAEMLALSAAQGWAAIRTDNSTTYLLATSSPGTLADWKVILAPGQVISVAGKTGVVALAGADISSGTVDIARLPLGASGSTVTVGNDSRFTTLASGITVVQTQATSTDTALTALTVRVSDLEDAAGIPGPGATAPGAPTAVSAAPGVQQAGVTFTPPASDGGSTITSYRATASTGQTGTGATSPILVKGLTAGVAVTFTVTATNAAGAGPASAPSTAVTPLAPPAATDAPAYVHSLGTGALTSSGTTVTVTTTNPAAAGNSLLVAITCNGNPGAITVTDASANTYRLDGVAANGAATSLYVYSSLLANALPSGALIRVTFTSARTVAAVQAHEVTGLTDKVVDDNAVGTANSSTALTTAALTTDVANDFVFCAWAMAGNNVLPGFTPGAGFTTGLASLAGTGGSSRDMYSEYLVKATAGTVNPAATVTTAKNWAGISVAYAAGFTGGVGGGAATGTYSDLASLNAAVPTAMPGDVMTLAAGTFSGKLVVSGIHGTAAEPILITGPSTAIFNNGNMSSGYGVQLDDCSYVTLHGFQVANCQKGVIVDRSTNCVIENLEVHETGQEGIHLRNETTHCKVRNNSIHDTGKVSPGFGEGLYCGTAESNWDAATRLPASMSGFPDHSDFNEFTGNTIYNVTAECMDIKEGTFGGVLSGNTFDGSLIAGANFSDSWVDVKGESWTISANTGTTIMTDGYQTHDISISSAFTAPYTDGLGVAHPGIKSGCSNVFDGNTSHCSPATGYGFNIASGTTGNVVYTNNATDNADAGASNIALTVKP